LMFLAMEEGSVCIEAGAAALERRLADLTGEAQAKIWAERIGADLRQDSFAKVIGAGPCDSKPLNLVRVGDKQFLYFHKFLSSELELRQALDGRIRPQPAQPADPVRDKMRDLDAWRPILREVLEEQP